MEIVVMKAWLKIIQAWRSRRQQRSLHWWERIRAKGKNRFVLEAALSYGVLTVGVTDVFEYLSYGAHYISLGHLIQHILTGMIVALFGWSSWEVKYDKALREALSDSKILPQTTTKQSPLP